MNIGDVSESFRSANGTFNISGVSLEEIVNETGSPVFIYDANTIQKQFNHLRENLPENFEIVYSTKANPNRAVIKLMHNLGAKLEVASEGGLYRVLSSGIGAKDVLFVGPGKEYSELSDAIAKNVHLSVESEGELKRVSSTAYALSKRPDIYLRINPKFKVKGAGLEMTGDSSQFGVDEEKLESSLKLIDSLNNLNCLGMHIYSASNVMSREGFLSNLKATLDFGNVMNKYIPVVKTIIGAGFGIPYDDSQRNLDLTGLNAQVEELVSQYPFVKQNETKFAVESGRFLVGQSGVYVTRIIDMKNSRGTNYAITDGGVHHMTRIPLLRDKSIGQDLVKYPIFNLSNNRQPLIGIDIAGCLCTPLDKLGKHVGLSSETKVGDYLGVFCAGAYGFSEGMVNFLSHDVPAEVLVHNNKYDIVNPSLSARELADREIIPYDLMEKR